MQQPPDNDPHPSDFYNDQTEAYPPYQPPQPGSFAPPARQPGLWARYRSAKKSIQWSIGCGAAILALIVCGMGASLGIVTSSSHPLSPHASVTPTGQTSDPTPTKTPTEQPSPTATTLSSPIPTKPPTPTPRPRIPIPTHLPIPTATIALPIGGDSNP